MCVVCGIVDIFVSGYLTVCVHRIRACVSRHDTQCTKGQESEWPIGILARSNRSHSPRSNLREFINGLPWELVQSEPCFLGRRGEYVSDGVLEGARP